jgi:hypothetical protein
MTSSPLTIWCNLQLTGRALAALQAGLGAHRLVRAAESTTCFQPIGRHDPALAEADVAFGQPEADQCVTSARLLWVHLASAGYTTFASDDIRAALLRSRHPADQQLLGLRRALRAARACLHAGRGPATATFDPRPGDDARLEHSAHAGGFVLARRDRRSCWSDYGAIAKRLAELLAPFRTAPGRVSPAPTRRRAHRRCTRWPSCPAGCRAPIGSSTSCRQQATRLPSSTGRDLPP